LVVIHKEGGYLCWEFCSFFRITLSKLGDEGDELTKVIRLLLGVEMKNLTNGIVVIPLLEKLLLVRFRIPLYQVLKLRKI